MRSFSTFASGLALVALALYHPSHAWQSPVRTKSFVPSPTDSALEDKTTANPKGLTKENSETTGRRTFLSQIAAACLAVAGANLVRIEPASAAVPSSSELARWPKGLSRVQYLLKNWDTETQICGKVVMSDTERRQVVRTEGKFDIYRRWMWYESFSLQAVGSSAQIFLTISILVIFLLPICK